MNTPSAPVPPWNPAPQWPQHPAPPVPTFRHRNPPRPVYAWLVVGVAALYLGVHVFAHVALLFHPCMAWAGETLPTSCSSGLWTSESQSSYLLRWLGFDLVVAFLAGMTVAGWYLSWSWLSWGAFALWVIVPWFLGDGVFLLPYFIITPAAAASAVSTDRRRKVRA